MYPIWGEGEKGKFLLPFPFFGQSLASPFLGPRFGFVVPIVGWLSLFLESRAKINGSNYPVSLSCEIDIFLRSSYSHAAPFKMY